MRRLWRWVKRMFRKPQPRRHVDEEPQPMPPIEDNTPTTGRKVSMAGIALIIRFEGFSASPYLDSAGVPTIGYGTIRYANGKMVRLSDPPITKERAKQELMYEVNQKTKWLNKTLKKYNFDAKQHEFDALASFAYNVGIGIVTNTKRSTVARGIANNDRDMIVKGMMRYVKAGGRRLRGLVRRRKAEVKMFKGE
jgi:lysozyme